MTCRLHWMVEWAVKTYSLFHTFFGRITPSFTIFLSQVLVRGAAKSRSVRELRRERVPVCEVPID